MQKNIKATVVHGAGRGKSLGAPTLNFDRNDFDLDFGVYLGALTFEQKKYSCIFHWGPRPTFHELEPVLEVHLLDQDMDLYGQEVSLEVLHFLREVRTFVSSEALQKQIQADLLEARAFFA